MASAVANLSKAASGNERFNEEAKSWDSRPFVNAASKEALTAITKRFQALNFQPKQVLEIGCGTGILSFLMAPYVERVVAIDAAQGMIDVLEQKIQRDDAPKNIVPIAILLEDPEDPSLPPADTSNTSGRRQKFDLITSHLVLHHIPELEAVLKTMFGCLAPTGRVMLTDFEDFGPEAKRFHAQSKMDGVARHGINVKDITAMMERVGFTNVDVRSHWTMQKLCEKVPGEFGKTGQEFGKPEEGKGEQMDIPFLICYGERPS